MSMMLEILKANVGLAVVLSLLVVGALVLGLVGLIMKSQAVSLRPIGFVGGLMLIVVLPQLVGHLVLARKPASRGEGLVGAGGVAVRDAQQGGSGGATELFSLQVEEGRFRDVERKMGGGLILGRPQDVRISFGEVLRGAEAAELGVMDGGVTVLVAQFAGEAGVWSAAAEYERVYGLREVEGDLEMGRRGKAALSGQSVEILARGRVLWVWTGADWSVVEERRRLSGVPVLGAEEAAKIRARRESLVGAVGLSQALGRAEEEAEPLIPALKPLKDFFQPWPVKLAGMLALGFVYVVVFFKGTIWAGGAGAVSGVRPISGIELGQRLEAINALDVPFRVERGQREHEWWVTWRYADAKWVDLARVQGLRRTFKVHLVLDEAARVVRATDHVAQHDWSAGARGVTGEWKRISGFVFFHWEHRRVLGLQMDEEGRLKPELSYAYTFHLQELRAPLIEVITRSGWEWRPTPWQSPAWLRWLTD